MKTFTFFTLAIVLNIFGFRANSQTVVVADIETDNGVVHVIDAVLIPSQATSKTELENANKREIVRFLKL